MNDDQYLNSLRAEARKLRYEPGDSFLETRMQARIRERIRAAPSVLDLITAWIRPVTAGLAVLIVASSIALYSVDASDTTDTLHLVAEAALLQEDVYLVGD